MYKAACLPTAEHDRVNIRHIRCERLRLKPTEASLLSLSHGLPENKKIIINEKKI